MVVLMADDDEDDRLVTSEAMGLANPLSEMRFVRDGQELLDYLRQEGDYVNAGGDAPTPDVILLDLNMPKMTGAEALAEIKADDGLRSIPVVVFSTSKRSEEVAESYQLGASSYISKPAGFEELVATLGEFRRYWFDLVELPTRRTN